MISAWGKEVKAALPTVSTNLVVDLPLELVKLCDSVVAACNLLILAGQQWFKQAGEDARFVVLI